MKSLITKLALALLALLPFTAWAQNYSLSQGEVQNFLVGTWQITPADPADAIQLTITNSGGKRTAVITRDGQQTTYNNWSVSITGNGTRGSLHFVGASETDSYSFRNFAEDGSQWQIGLDDQWRTASKLSAGTVTARVAKVPDAPGSTATGPRRPARVPDAPGSTSTGARRPAVAPDARGNATTAGTNTSTTTTAATGNTTVSGQRVDRPTPGGGNAVRPGTTASNSTRPATSTTTTSTTTSSTTAAIPSEGSQGNLGKPGPKLPTGATNIPKQLTRDVESITINGVTFKMVRVGANEFLMGYGGGEDNRENNLPEHQVAITSDYYIGETEVTQELYLAVMGEVPWNNFTGYKKPVGWTTWQRSVDFCKRLSEVTGLQFSLPTEAQWELAAKGADKANGTNYRYCGSDNLDEVAWHVGNSGKQIHDVATKKPNQLGLYDMSGNAHEWVYDDYVPYPSTRVANATGLHSGKATGNFTKLTRGGSAYTDYRVATVTHRWNWLPENVDEFISFRLAAAASPRTTPQTGNTTVSGQKVQPGNTTVSGRKVQTGNQTINTNGNYRR